MSEIKIVRLNSGEEILCKHTLKDGMHTLEKPLVIIPTGEGKIGFMGWMPYADIEKTGVNISDSFVAFVVLLDLLECLYLVLLSSFPFLILLPFSIFPSLSSLINSSLFNVCTNLSSLIFYFLPIVDFMIILNFVF